MTSNDPAGDGLEQDWPDDLWPDDEDDEGGQRHDQWPPPCWPEVPALPVYGDGTPRWPRWTRLALTAVVALCAGAAATYAVRDIGGASPTTTAQPETGGSGQSGGPQPQGGALPSGGSAMATIDGRVLAVSPTSITIAAGPDSVTATVTSSTRFSGHVTRIGQVRIGDMVLALIAESNTRGSVVALQDPASVP